MLLPITDSVGGSIGYSVYLEVEAYLKDTSWCYYRSNSEIINILQNYKKNLYQHLDNSEVLKNIADKIKVGNLLKVKLKNEPKGTSVELNIIGQNGKDLYFREYIVTEQSDPIQLGRIIINWLEVFKTTIPYDGQIIGILGDQFTIDIGKASFVRIGQKVDILRPTKKKQHPLLKEIVEWESEVIAYGKIFNVSEFQARGKVTNFAQRKQLRTKDWVLIKKDQAVTENFQNKYPDINKDQFGKLGTLKTAIEIGQGNTLANKDGTRKISSPIFGFAVNGELWATRNFWGGLELFKRFGSYKKQDGDVTLSSNSVSPSGFKLKAGYKYLPLGFFYGPQVDGYIGYGTYKYGMDTSTSDGFTTVKFKGLLLGVRGDVPIVDQYRIFGKIEFIFNPTFEEETVIYQASESTSNTLIELGGSYVYNTLMTFNLSYQSLKNRASFTSSSASEISFSDNVIRAGITFSY